MKELWYGIQYKHPLKSVNRHGNGGVAASLLMFIGRGC